MPCFYCDNEAEPGTLDHVFPRSAVRRMVGLFPDSWHALNKVPCCERCNLLKGNMTPLQWLPLVPTEAGSRRLIARLTALGVAPTMLREGALRSDSALGSVVDPRAHTVAVASDSA